MLYLRGDLIKYVELHIKDSFVEDIKTISKYLVDDMFGYQQTILFDDVQWVDFNDLVNQLKQGKPLQYVTNKAYFLDTVLYVDERVLIPRPETEDLVLKTSALIKKYEVTNILEVGIGSGCISIEIKKRNKKVKVLGVDVSNNALNVASINIKNEDLNIDTSQFDFLDETNWSELPRFDLIVSNPPYISAQEEEDMEGIVLDYEPHIALFSKLNPDLFYQKIESFARETGVKYVVCEMNASRYQSIMNVFPKEFWKVNIYDDLQMKPRIIEAIAV